MENPYDSVRKKVAAIFFELAGDRAKVLDGAILPTGITSAITAALTGSDDCDERLLQNDQIAFHLTDWNADAAFLVALHLFPEKFTLEEIRAGIDLFLVHVPAHVIAAARLAGNSVEDTFTEST